MKQNKKSTGVQGPHCWVVRPKPYHEDRMADFLWDGIVALGWKGLGNLKGCNRAEIKKRLLLNWDGQPSAQDVGRVATEFHRLANEMTGGDLVIVPQEADVHIAVVRGPYEYVPGRGKNALEQRVPVEYRAKVERKLFLAEAGGHFVQNSLYEFSGDGDAVRRMARVAPANSMASPPELPAMHQEFSGISVYTPAHDPVIVEHRHGRVCKALQEAVESLGHPCGKDTKRDLYIVDRKGAMQLLFEIKVYHDPYDIYTAVGQLFCHCATHGEKASKIAVLPEGLSKDCAKILMQLGIAVQPYRESADDITFPGLATLVERALVGKV